jgi:glyoxylase-like metal-dependent hydrolase (beta-lactamase superfamily II)
MSRRSRSALGADHVAAVGSAAAIAQGGGIMKLNFLAAGRLRMRKSVFIQGADRSDMIDLPVVSALIRHRQGNVLFDTGCHPAVVDDAATRWGALAKVMTPVMAVNETLLPSLAGVGLEPDDIDMVVNSHFHTDHCGCNRFFRRATIMAHAREVEAATAARGDMSGYVRADWDCGQPIETVNGEKDLFGDGDAVLMPLPGHTPGTLGALVSLDRDGQFLLTSDAVSLRANLDADSPPRNTWNVEAQLKSFDEVRRIEKSGATVICGHDDQQWQSLRKGCDGYE